MAADVRSVLLAALSEVHSDASTAEQRMHGQQVLEHFKAHSPPSLLLATATSLLSSAQPPQPPLGPSLSGDVLLHFSLHLLEHLLAQHWAALPASDQAVLQSYTLRLLQSLCTESASPPSHLLTQKAVALTSAVVLRSWPQHWPGLLPSLSALPQQSPVMGALVVCLLYRELCEEVTSVGAVAEARRKDVQAALLQGMDTVFPFLLTALTSAEPRVVQAALAALRAMVDWLPARWLFDTDLVPRLLSALGGAHFPAVMDLLTAVAGRKTVDTDVHGRMSDVWRGVLRSIEALLAAPAFGHQYSYLKGSLGALGNLTRLHSALLTTQPSGASSDPSATSPLLPRFLSVLGALLSHGHPSVSVDALELWVFVFRHEAARLLPSEYRASLVAELFKVVVVKVMKQQSDSIPHTDDALEDADYVQLFSHFRGTLTALIGHMVQLEPLTCFALASRRYEEILASGSVGLDHVNAAGYTSTSSTRFRELESMAVMLDSMFRGLSSEALSDPSLLDTATALLARLLSYRTHDPLLQTRRLQALSLFTPVMLQRPATLPPTVSALLSSVTFRSEREQGKALSELSEDTRACRRRAVHSLTHIARGRCGAVLVSSLEPSLRAVQELVGSGQLREEESVLLMEFLVTVSGALPQREGQADFVRRIIGPQMERWLQPDTQQTLAGGEGWLQLIGGGQDEVDAVRAVVATSDADAANMRRRVKEAVRDTKGRRMRNEVLGALHAFSAVFRGVLGKTEDVHTGRSTHSTASAVEIAHPSAALLFALLPSFLMLLSSIYGLRSPSFFPLLPPTLHSVLAASVDHLQLLRSFSSASLATPDHLHSVLIHHFLDEATEALLQLLSTATKAGSWLFARFDLSLVQSALLVHVPYMHVRQLRFLLERFVGHALLECDARPHPAGLMALLGPTCTAAVTRLRSAWGDVRVRQEGARSGGGGGEEAVEIWEDTELRECTRCFADCFARVVNAFDFRTDKVHVVKDASNHVSLAECPFFAAVFAQPPLSSAVLSALCFLLQAPDSQAQSKGARVALRCVSLASGRAEAHEQLAQLLATCLTALSSIYYSPSTLSTLDNDMIALASAVYQQAGRGSAAVRSVVQQWTATAGSDAEAALRDLDARVWAEPMSEKRYRALTKAWMERAVLGRHGGKRTVQVAALKDAWERNTGRDPANQEPRGPQLEAGELHALFEAPH